MAALIRQIEETRVHIGMNTLDLIDPEVMDISILDYADNGLVAAGNHGSAGVATAIEVGHINVTAELWDGPPALLLDDWQDVAEISLTWPTTAMYFGDDEDGPRLTLPGPGGYRLLVHGRHRDDGDVRDLSDPVETYLLQLWPAPVEKPVTHKATSRLGATLRNPEPQNDPGHIHGMSYADIAAQRRDLEGNA